MRLTLLATVAVDDNGLILVREVDGSNQRVQRLRRLTGNNVLVTFETDEDAMAMRTRADTIRLEERARALRLFDELLAGHVVDDDVRERLDRWVVALRTGKESAS